MKRYRLITIVFLVTFIGGAVFNFVRNSRSDDTQKELEARQSVLPAAERFSKKQGSPPHYKAFRHNASTGKDELVGLAFLTTDVVPKIRGYAGPIKLMVGTDTKGTIQGVEVIKHSETPSYVLTLDEFLKQFVSLNIKSAFKLGDNIDGITRATITCEAITRAVEQSLKMTAQQILNLEVADVAAKETRFPGTEVYVTLLIFFLAILGVYRHNTSLRWAALLSGLVYLGIIKSTMVSVVQVANIGLLKFPVFQDIPMWYLLIFLTLITSFTLGMVYCGSVCPFATVQELLYNVVHFKKKISKQKSLSKEVDEGARYIKYAVLITAVLASLLLGNSSPATVEVFLTFFTTNATTLGWGFLIFILIISLFHFRFWCKYLCPVGALTGLMARASIFKIKLDGECPGCSVCDKICPTQAIRLDQNRKPIIDPAECILCGKCMQGCPKGTLKFKNG